MNIADSWVELGTFALLVAGAAWRFWQYLVDDQVTQWYRAASERHRASGSASTTVEYPFPITNPLERAAADRLERETGARRERTDDHDRIYILTGREMIPRSINANVFGR